MKRQCIRRIPMLGIRESAPPSGGPNPGVTTRGRDATKLLLDVLGNIEPYEACILEAERDGDLEVADLLRELRRQDLVRAREATRLLRRKLEAADGEVEKEKAAC
jgi:hypothetical protein